MSKGPGVMQRFILDRLREVGPQSALDLSWTLTRQCDANAVRVSESSYRSLLRAIRRLAEKGQIHTASVFQRLRVASDRTKRCLVVHCWLADQEPPKHEHGRAINPGERFARPHGSSQLRAAVLIPRILEILRGNGGQMGYTDLCYRVASKSGDSPNWVTTPVRRVLLRMESCGEVALTRSKGRISGVEIIAVSVPRHTYS